MKITYSPKGDGKYDMKAGATFLGMCIKAGGEFYFTPADELGKSFEVRARTMKGVKEEIETLLPDILTEKVDGRETKERHFTIFEAREFAGLSHNEVRELVREIHEFHRYLNKKHWGDFMVRRAMENQAEFEWGKHARVWLAKNPNTGNYEKPTTEQWALYTKKTHTEVKEAA